MNHNLPSAKDMLVFGNRSMASMVWHGLTHDACRQVAGFVVNKAYATTGQHEGLPLYAFEDLADIFPDNRPELIIPVGSVHINGIRRSLCEQARALGFSLGSYVSRKASYFPDTPMGEHCLVFEHAVIQSFARLGSNVVLRSGANIGHHNVIEDHCFIATGVVTGGNVSIGEQSFIGLGAIIRDGVTIAPRSLIGAGAVVLRDTEPDGVYVGNPARKIAKTSLEATSDAS